jgi:hypothetical protein
MVMAAEGAAAWRVGGVHARKRRRDGLGLDLIRGHGSVEIIEDLCNVVNDPDERGVNGLPVTHGAVGVFEDDVHTRRCGVGWGAAKRPSG